MGPIDAAMLYRACIYDLDFPGSDLKPFFEHEVRGLHGARQLLELVAAGGDPADWEPLPAVLPAVAGVPLREQMAALERLAAFHLDATAPPLDTWMREPAPHAGVWHLSAGTLEGPPDPGYAWQCVIARCHRRNRVTLRGPIGTRTRGTPETLDTATELPTDGPVCDLCREIAAGTRRPVWPKVAR